MAKDSSQAPENSLGLDFDASTRLTLSQSPSQSIGQAADTNDDGNRLNDVEASQSSPGQSGHEGKEKKKPYINPERVKTGGSQRDKLTEEELIERISRMREQNEKIKLRRMDVKADEDAFQKTQESDLLKLAHSRKVQESVNRTREQNARRKMDKVQNREWDSGKSTSGDWKRQTKSPVPDIFKAVGKEGPLTQLTDANSWTRTAVRGAPRGRSKGRGRGAVDHDRGDKSEPNDNTSVPNGTTVV